MSCKRKQPTRLTEGDLDASEFVSIRQVWQTGKDGHTSFKRLEEPVFNHPSAAKEDILIVLGSCDQGQGDFSMQTTEADPANEEVVACKPTKV